MSKQHLSKNAMYEAIKKHLEIIVSGKKKYNIERTATARKEITLKETQSKIREYGSYFEIE